MSTLDGSPRVDSGSADDADAADESPSTPSRFVARSLATGLERAAYWTAVVLPFLYVPLLFGGVTTSGERSALAFLVLLNVVALYLGHGYDPR